MLNPFRRAAAPSPTPSLRPPLAARGEPSCRAGAGMAHLLVTPEYLREGIDEDQRVRAELVYASRLRRLEDALAAPR